MELKKPLVCFEVLKTKKPMHWVILSCPVVGFKKVRTEKSVRSFFDILNVTSIGFAVMRKKNMSKIFYTTVIGTDPNVYFLLIGRDSSSTSSPRRRSPMGLRVRRESADLLNLNPSASATRATTSVAAAVAPPPPPPLSVPRQQPSSPAAEAVASLIVTTTATASGGGESSDRPSIMSPQHHFPPADADFIDWQ